MIPFRNLSRLFVGDFLAKTLYFLAFVYLARVLGVSNYGVLEFSLSILTYFMVLADGGLELWATRESARGQEVRALVGRVMPLRSLMAVGAFLLLIILLPRFPDYPGLTNLLVLFGLSLFSQALSLKWAFMGREEMSRVAVGLVLTQIVFALAIFVFVREPDDVIVVPVLRLIGDLAMAFYYGRAYIRLHGRKWPSFSLRNTRGIMRPALTMGASHGLAFMSYNFDTVLLGFISGSEAVGWYGAAYKPITAILAVPVTYFLGLFPTLSRTFKEDSITFSGIVTRSLRILAIFAFPVGVGGIFMAGPIVALLFGPDYTNSVLPLRILSLAASLIILRGTFRQALNAAGRQDLDLRCAGASVGLNVGLNLLLIPQYGIVGAAITTVVAEVLWLTLASYYFRRYVAPISFIPFVWQPLIAAAAMSIYFLLTPSLLWWVQATISGLVYFGALLLLGETEVRSWVRILLVKVS